LRPTSEVFAPLARPKDATLPGDPLLAFHPSPEPDRTEAVSGRVAPSVDCLPCGSFPFGVFLVRGSHSSRGIPALGYVPPQRFARSRGFLPLRTCRPCSMPVPPLGFLPSGSISTRRAVRHLWRRCPPEVGDPRCIRLDARVGLGPSGCPGHPDRPGELVEAAAPTRVRGCPVCFAAGALPSSRSAGLPHLGWPDRSSSGRVASASLRTPARRRLCRDSPLSRALLPASVRVSGPIVQANPGTATLVGFSSLGASPSSPTTRPGVHPPTSFAPGAHARPDAAPRSVVPAKRSAGLPRACLPFRGSSPPRPSATDPDGILDPGLPPGALLPLQAGALRCGSSPPLPERRRGSFR
jgi:hypothetical protein